MSGWMNLFVAAIFEVGFTTSLKWMSHGGGWAAQTTFIVCIILSFTFLERAAATIPIGVAYAVWTGLGAVGTVVVARFAFGEVLMPLQYVFVGLLVVSVVGLKLTSVH